MNDRKGFIRDELRMKFLIIYALHCIKVPVTFADLSELCLWDEAIDFFDFSNAVSSLIKSKHVNLETRRQPELYSLAPAGEDMFDVAEQNLPYTVKRETQKSVLLVSSKLEREKNVKVETVHRPDGTQAVRLNLKDDRTTLMRLEILVGNDSQADLLSRNFKKNAEVIFNRVLRDVTDS